MSLCSARAGACLFWAAGELAGVSLQALGSQFGDSTAQWLYRLARGCDTEEVHAPGSTLLYSQAHIRTLLKSSSQQHTDNKFPASPITGAVSRAPSQEDAVHITLSTSSLLCLPKLQLLPNAAFGLDIQVCFCLVWRSRALAVGCGVVVTCVIRCGGYSRQLTLC